MILISGEFVSQIDIERGDAGVHGPAGLIANARCYLDERRFDPMFFPDLPLVGRLLHCFPGGSYFVKGLIFMYLHMT